MPFDKAKAPFSLPKLPYADDALAPVVSANTTSTTASITRPTSRC